MTIDKMIGIINSLDYDNVEECIIPVKDLLILRRHILALRKDKVELDVKLRQEINDHNKTRSEAMKILAKDEILLTRFDTYC